MNGHHWRGWAWIAFLAALAWGRPDLHAGVVTLRLGSPAEAGPGKAKKPSAPLPVAYVLKAKAPPSIDGKLAEADWARAEALMLARTLDGSRPAPQPTEVRLLRDAKSLYIAFRCTEPLTRKIKASRGSHDGNLWDEDSVEVFLGTAEQYYHFIVNAVGSTCDGRGKETGWDSGFQAAGAVGEGKWTAEMAIPLAKMVPRGKVPDRWLGAFNRNRHAAGRWEESAWSPTFSGDSHVPSRFGKLRFQDPPPGRRPKSPEPAEARWALSLLRCQGGEGVVRFDLSRLARGVRVYRADLLVHRNKQPTAEDEAIRVNMEIHALLGEFKEGSSPRFEGKPLALRPPWFDRFDATEAVRARVGGKPNGGFFVKALPYWDAGRTCLEIAYEGKPKNVPPQATGLDAFHRSGQTFLTWKEIHEPVRADQPKWGKLRAILKGLDRDREIRYCIYRSREPITAETLSGAERIATVKPVSCWNINGRNIEKPIDELLTQYALDHHQWNPFVDARVDGPFGVDCRMERLVIRDSAEPLARGTGLYVHTTAEKGAFHYAVVTCVDGVQNTAAFTKANSLAQPLAEAPAEPRPVLQKELPRRPYWNYPEKRYHYVRWVGPPYGNLPCMYYNWSVAVPNELGKAAPLELSLHRDEYSYYRTQYRIEQDSVVVSPHDFPLRTWWYGYHEAHGTLKSFRQGVIHNYTERRMLWFLDWAAGNWPLDRSRITVTGMGGMATSGGLHLGLRHPKVFNTVQVGSGAWADYRGAVECLAKVRGGRYVPAVQRLWGKIEWGLKTNTGRSVWEELDCTRRIQRLPANTELPLVTMTDRRIRQPTRDFFVAMLNRGHPIMARFGMWGGGALLPVGLTGNWSRMVHVDVRRGLSLPAFLGPGANPLNDSKPDGLWAGNLNDGFRWDRDDSVDRPGRYEITLRCVSARDRLVPAAVTLRRLQRFKATPGKTYAWEFRPLKAGKDGTQRGRTAVGDEGLLIVPRLLISSTGGRLIVTPE